MWTILESYFIIIPYYYYHTYIHTFYTVIMPFVDGDAIKECG